MTQLLLVRHGTTAFNTEHRFLGRTDTGLSPLGFRQVERLRDYLAGEKMNAVYCSDLNRAMTTAEIIRGDRAIPITHCSELREWDYGVCEGLTFGEIKERHPDLATRLIPFSRDVVFPEGEAFQYFVERSSGFLERIKRHGPSETILVVSHNGPVRTLICRLLGISLDHWWQMRIDVASLSIVELNPRGAFVLRLNDTFATRGLS
jgi:broad specificity phosphatase PhoE